jgi:hypothetical protein
MFISVYDLVVANLLVDSQLWLLFTAYLYKLDDNTFNYFRPTKKFQTNKKEFNTINSLVEY